MHEAKTHFSKLVKKANEGEEIIVTNRGTPVATIQPVQEVKPKRRFGGLKHLVIDSSGFEALDKEVLEMFEESANEPMDPADRSHRDCSVRKPRSCLG